jgi:hypothetical protein
VISGTVQRILAWTPSVAMKGDFCHIGSMVGIIPTGRDVTWARLERAGTGVRSAAGGKASVEKPDGQRAEDDTKYGKQDNQVGHFV